MAVPINDNALLTVADLRGESGPLGLTGTDAATTDMIQELINRASDQIEAYCGRPIKEQDYVTAEFEAQYGRNLRPPATPIDVDSTITLTLDGSALTVWRKPADGAPADFDVQVRGDTPGGPKTFLYRESAWLGATRWPILLTYTGGFATIPGGVKEAATLTVQAFHRHGKGLDPYSSYPASATGGTVVMRTDTIPRTAEMLLEPYRFVRV